MPAVRPLLAWLASVAASGCATIAAPGPDSLPVTSEPAGAQVSVDGFDAAVGEPPPAVVTLQRHGPAPVVRDRRREAVFALATGAGFPEFVTFQAGPMVGPVSLDARLGLGILDAYAGGGLTAYVLETPASAYGGHAFVLAARQMWNLDPDQPSGGHSRQDGDYSFDLEFHGPDWQASGQAGWIYTAAFGMQVRALGGVCRIEGNARLLPSVDLGMGWVF